MSALSLFLLSSEAEKLSDPLELEFTGCELLCGGWEQNSPSAVVSRVFRPWLFFSEPLSCNKF